MLSGRKIIIIPSLLLILFVLFSVACPNPEESAEQKTSNDLVLNDDLIILPREAGEKIMAVSLFDSRNLQMTLSVDPLSSLAQFDTGKILALGITEMTPQGLLQRIQKVSRVDGRVIYQTRAASLEQAISSGRIERRIPIDFTDISQSKTLLPGVEFQGASKVLNSSFSYHLDNTELYQNDDSIRVKARGNAAFNLSARIIREFKNHHQIKTSYDTQIEQLSPLQLEIKGDLSQPPAPVMMATHTLKPVYYSISGFPVVELLEMEVYLDSWGTLSVILKPLNKSFEHL